MGGCLGTRTAPVTPTSPPAILVDYHRTDGIAGFNDRLVVFDNGAAVISSGIVTREIMLNKSDLDRISSVFTNAQFSMLEGNYTASRASADLIHYSISYHSKTVNTVDTATPPSLQPVIDELNRLMRTGTGPEQPANPFANMPT
jgi:hypothetical protein